jgi:hypothetical protein
MFPLTAKKKGFSVRLTAIAHGCVIPETELEVEVFEKTVMLHPEEPIPEALKNPFSSLDQPVVKMSRS